MGRDPDAGAAGPGDSARPHPAVRRRTIDVDGAERPYTDLLRWIGIPGEAYLPSTVVPVGLTPDGLPVGVQIVGPYLDDRTTLDVAARLLELSGPCPRPPGF